MTGPTEATGGPPRDPAAARTRPPADGGRRPPEAGGRPPGDRIPSGFGRAWSRREWLALAAILLGGLALRVALWPADELTGDMDEFAGWIHGIARDGWANTYEQPVTFPAVMAWLWGALAAIQPAFAHVLDASDAGIRALMKAPASLADLAIAGSIVYWYRWSPERALLMAAAILFLPVTWYVSAWWGQYESLYVLPALLAVLAANAGRPGFAVALMTVALMTKPQALPFVVPFVAWFLATHGWRAAARAEAISVAVAIAVWVPFLATGGPADYLATVQSLQDGSYNVLSLRAWNPWWLLQGALAGSDFVLDGNALVGPVTFRHLGLVLAAILQAVVFVAVYRRPTVGRLALGLAVASLAAFVALTTMHERYAYPAVIFLALLVANRRLFVAWALLAAAVSLNLLAAAPPTPEIGRLLPTGGPLAIAGTIAILVAFGLALARLVGPLGPSTDGGARRRWVPSRRST